MNEICPECKEKSMYWRSAFNSWRYGGCYCEFDKDKKLLDEKDMLIDKNNNRYKVNIQKLGNKIIQTITYFLGNKKTLKGDYPKFKNNNECPYPERLDCNYGIGYERCLYMKFQNNTWICEYKNEFKDFKNDEKNKENQPI